MERDIGSPSPRTVASDTVHAILCSGARATPSSQETYRLTRGDRFREVAQEFRTVVVQRSHIVDAVLPPLAFVLLDALAGFSAASWGSLLVGVALGAFRVIRGEPLAYVLGGLGATALAILSARLSNRAEGYFLPNLVSGGLTALICLGSVILGRPLVALTSHLVRGWPLRWYWHAKVRPAYSEVTLAWAIFFALRLALQWLLLQQAKATVLGLLNIAMGWPATIVLLVVSYLYGTWRLRDLGGPSVEELQEGVSPPWRGQQRGF